MELSIMCNNLCGMTLVKINNTPRNSVEVISGLTVKNVLPDMGQFMFMGTDGITRMLGLSRNVITDLSTKGWSRFRGHDGHDKIIKIKDFGKTKKSFIS